MKEVKIFIDDQNSSLSNKREYRLCKHKAERAVLFEIDIHASTA